MTNSNLKDQNGISLIFFTIYKKMAETAYCKKMRYYIKQS